MQMVVSERPAENMFEMPAYLQCVCFRERAEVHSVFPPNSVALKSQI